MGFVIWIVAGALLGGAAGALVGGRGRFALNVATGVTGVLFGGWLLGMLIGASAFGADGFGIGSLLVSLLGASILLAGLNEFGSFRYESVRNDMKNRFAVGPALRPLATMGLAGLLIFVVSM